MYILKTNLHLYSNYNGLHIHVYPGGGGGGHSLVSSVPMRDQRIVEHTLNSVIDI